MNCSKLWPNFWFQDVLQYIVKNRNWITILQILQSWITLIVFWVLQCNLFAGGRFCGPASPTKLWTLKLASSPPASSRSILPPTCCVWKWTALLWNTTQSWMLWSCEAFGKDPFWPSIRSLSSTSMIWVTVKRRSVMQEASAAGRVEKTGTTWGTATLIGSLMRLALETLSVITNDACEFWNV